MKKRRIPARDARGARLLWDIAAAYVADSTASENLKRKLRGAIRERSIERICDYDLPDPEHHPQEFLILRQLQAFFKKNAEFVDEAKCSKNAAESFHASELKCRITNRRLSWFYDRRDRLDPDLVLLIESVERDIRALLGEVKDFLVEMPLLMKVTGGATEDRSRRRSLPFLKISRRLRITPAAEPLLRAYLKHVGYANEPRITRTLCNRVEFVPKNHKIHRTIACEPTGLIPFQLAGDSFIKRKLLRWGIDLRSQERNQELARKGSIDGSYATIDLKSASDTLALTCVDWLLPAEWLPVLKKLRSPCYKGVVGEGVYAKYASMGNGLTFVLETLIFAAFARVVSRGIGEYAVYGDDIIVPTESVPRLLRLLRFFGFAVNTEKSFISGPFRESCGADWMRGVLVTPFYIRKLPKHPSEMCHLVNGIVLVSAECGGVWEIARRETRHLPLVPECESTGAGVHIPYRAAQDRRIVSTSTPKYGNYVPCCLQWVSIGATRREARLTSYLVWLLFGERVQRDPYDHRDDDPKDSVDKTLWPTGQTRYALRRAPVRPWSRSSSTLDVWNDFLLEDRPYRRS